MRNPCFAEEHQCFCKNRYTPVNVCRGNRVHSDTSPAEEQSANIKRDSDILDSFVVSTCGELTAGSQLIPKKMQATEQHNDPLDVGEPKRLRKSE